MGDAYIMTKIKYLSIFGGGKPLNNPLQNSAPTSKKTLLLIYPEMPHNCTVGIYKCLL